MKTIRILLVAAVLMMTALTGCNSENKDAAVKSGPVTTPEESLWPQSTAATTGGGAITPGHDAADSSTELSDTTTNAGIEAAADDIEVREESEMWSELHKMINTKIVADEVWGLTNITPELCDVLLAEVTQSEYQHKEAMLKMLANWRDGDFRNAVEEHNYLWELLGGTVGEATGLTEETREAMKERFGE